MGNGWGHRSVAAPSFCHSNARRKGAERRGKGWEGGGVGEGLGGSQAPAGLLELCPPPLGIAWGWWELPGGDRRRLKGERGSTRGWKDRQRDDKRGWRDRRGGTDEGTAGGTWARPALTRGPAAPATSRNAPLGFTRQSPQRSGRGG